MTKTPTPPTSAEHLKEVAAFLKQADKFVREGDFAAALEQIATARARDPRNLYAMAYEERVKSLLAAATGQGSTARDAGSTLPSDPAAIHHISNLAILEAQRSADLALRQEQGEARRRKEEEDRKIAEQTRRAAIEAKVASLLMRAREFEEAKEFERAFAELTRASLLDTVNADIRTAQERVQHSLEEHRAQLAVDQRRREEEEQRRRQEFLQAQSTKLRQESEEQRRREEEARREAQRQKIMQRLESARQLLAERKLDEALNELSFAVVLDPLNEAVLELDRQIRDEQDRMQREQMELQRRKEESQRRREEAVLKAIRKHIDDADLMVAEQRFAEALRVVARAYVLDPINNDIQACERRILAAQDEARREEDQVRKQRDQESQLRREEELRRIEEKQRERTLQDLSAEVEAKKRSDRERIARYVANARVHVDEGRFEDALGEIALAFIVDPLDEDVRMLEEEVLAARNQRLTENAAPLETEQQQADAAAELSAHLEEAARFAADHDYVQALDEVAKAFAIDPLNPLLHELEERLQREFTEFREQQRIQAERERKEALVRGRVAFARDLMSNAAFEEALGEIAGGLAEFPQQPDLMALETEIRTAYDEWLRVRTNQERESQIRDYVTAAQGFLVRGEFSSAIEEVTKALVLDPASTELRQLESQIEDARTLSLKRAKDAERDKAIEQHVFRAKEFKFHRMFEEAVGELDAALALDDTREDLSTLRGEFAGLFERWKQDKTARDLEEAVAQHLKQARVLIDTERLDEALIEVMMGIALAPDNADLLAMERELNDRQASAAANEEQEATEATAGLGREDNERLIRIHLRAAAQYSEQKEYAKALDEIAKAFAIDPTHKETKRLEVRIRQQYPGNEQTLRLVIPTNRAAGEAAG